MEKKEVMLEEMVARNIVLTDKEKRNYRLAIARLKKVGNNKSLEPVLPFERFKWY